MTPVQQKVLTELPSDTSDCLVQAKTGTGKTIAFLLPVLQTLISGKPFPRGQVAILIMSPTRELVLQIKKECDQLTAKLPRMECHTAFGGTSRSSNLNRFLEGNPSILVATPGRLNDYLGEESVRRRFQNLRTLILDEADRMLDQGFLPEIQKALKRLPPKSDGWQGMAFSATVPPSIMSVIDHILFPGYTRLSTVEVNETPTIDSVDQFVVVVPSVRETFATLFALINQEFAANSTNFKTIVFGTTANGVALLHSLFEQLAPRISPELKVFQLQSRLTQNYRTRTTNEFKEAKSGLMFASDVIGRGMDFPNVGLVIQLGLPANSEQYIHRVGRTARAGHKGRAVLVLTEQESYFTRINRNLPIHQYPIDLTPVAINTLPQVESAFDSVDPVSKTKAYQAFLGFNKTFMKNLRTNNEGLVEMANIYSEAMQCPEPPMIEKRVVGKMGFKNVRGLRVGTAPRDPMPTNKPPGARPARNEGGNQLPAVRSAVAKRKKVAGDSDRDNSGRPQGNSRRRKQQVERRTD
jgi:ATP-dependent RNA helicase MSS116